MKRYVLITILGLVFLLPFTTSAFSGHEGCGGNCSDCHKLEKSEAEGIVKKVVPDGHVLDIKISPVKSIWQIDVEANGKHGALYLDFSKKYLIAGQIVPIDAVGKPAPQRKIEFSKLPLKDALVMGPKHAKKKVAVFTDPDCPFCQKLHAEIKQVLAKRKDVAFYIFLRPLPMHGQDAYKKAQAIVCAKSSTLLDDALSGKAVPEPTCGNEQIEKNNALADSLEFRGTPTIVREDGMVNPGYLPAEQLSAWIDGK
jgi:thiol:disulfide interchange protein DsbC